MRLAGVRGWGTGGREGNEKKGVGREGGKYLD